MKKQESRKGPKKQLNSKPSARVIACWCGNSPLERWSPTYLRCPVCETLILEHWPPSETFSVQHDDKDFYGRGYYESHLINDYGQHSLQVRARKDLPERCTHWLQTLIQYKLPPDKFLELGSGHGGFTAMTSLAGFDAIGLEMSPWVVKFAKQNFSVRMLTGPIETQKIHKKSLEIIAMMDVIEHLPDPLQTLRSTLSLLNENGILMIQTPRYPEGVSFSSLKQNNDRFLEHLKEQEHLYLFSKTSIKELFKRLDAPHITFEPAYFSFYDMFFVVSKKPLKQQSPERIVKALEATPGGRMILALLDTAEERSGFERRLVFAETDRAARLRVIEEQGLKLGEVEVERNLLKGQVSDLQKHFENSEADRAARLRVIEEQSINLGEVEAERNLLIGRVSDLQKHFENSEVDRAKRLRVIEEQGLKLGEVEAERNVLMGQLSDLQKHFENSEADRANRLRVIEEQGAKLGQVERQRKDLQLALDESSQKLSSMESDLTRRIKTIDEQASKIVDLIVHVENLKKTLADVEQVSHEKDLLIEAQEHQMNIIMSQLRALQELFSLFQKSHVYRFLRGVGRLKWIEDVMSQKFVTSLRDETATKKGGKGID